MRTRALMLTLALAVPAAAREKAAPRPEAATYQAELERRGLVDKTLGTPERLAAEVRAADDEIVQGRYDAAAARLWAVVEGPRWQDLADTDDYQDAEYRLGLALHKGGGGETARRYLVRVLARGKKAPFYEAGLRTYVDTCLDERIVAACVEELDRLAPEDVGEELAYLRGRALFEAGKLKDADDELSRVTPQSRFYSAALYLRGVGRVDRGDFAGAKDAFCTVAGKGTLTGGRTDEDTLRFFVDGRYYALRDLARLALGRLAHEERRYDDAFYHYFLIPQDSPKLGDALFESAWSSLERREFDLGARLVEEFLKLYPSSPRAFEAKLLYATLQVKTCRFSDAEKGFSAFLTAYEPLTAAIDRALADPAQLSAITARLVARARGEQASQPSRAARPDSVEVMRGDAAPESDPQLKTIAELLDVDPRFDRLQQLARGLRREAADAGHTVDDWRALEARLGTRVQPVATGPDAAQLAADVRALGRAIAAARGKVPQAQLAALEARRQQLVASLQPALEARRDEAPTAGIAALVQADRAHAQALEARAAALDARLDAASRDLVCASLVELRGRCDNLLRRARLGKIDAVVGQKRKLEKQIEDLAAGRFPPEMFGKLHIEGLIQDDEEYWPPEKEYWADEYEGYK